VRRARNDKVPESFYKDPLMYQGGAGAMMGPRDPIRVLAEEWGVDLEGEVAAIVGDVAMGATPKQAADAIRLVTLVNDVSFRRLIPAELAKGFGFVNGKGANALAPVADQNHHRQLASADREQRASVNHGRPAIAASHFIFESSGKFIICRNRFYN